jgi:hypothetical protein
MTAIADDRIYALCDIMCDQLQASLSHALDTQISGVASGHLLGAEYQGSSTTMRQTVVTLGAVWVF